MLSLVRATRFDRRMAVGKTRPCLVSCERDDGSEVSAIAKFSKGCERGIAGLVTEAMSAMFAADLELPVPDPLLVRFTPEMIDLIPDAEIRQLAVSSSHVAFGSTLLPPSFSVWIYSRAIPQQLQQQALEIFAFDALVMNADRRPLNPNCQSNGMTFAVYDHELAFVAPLFGPAVWEINGLEYLRTPAGAHVFKEGLQGAAPNLDRFAGAVESVTAQRVAEYVGALPTEWTEDSGAAVSAANHINALRGNIEAAITEVIRVLS